MTCKDIFYIFLFGKERCIIAEQNSNNPEQVNRLVEAILLGKMGVFTGTVDVDFEDNIIFDINVSRVTPKTELKKVTIHKSRFEDLLNSYDKPEDSDEELKFFREGLPKEKLEKAIRIKAENIYKDPFLKLDGSIEYELTAAVPY